MKSLEATLIAGQANTENETGAGEEEPESIGEDELNQDTDQNRIVAML
jgi:hypothetical protein